MTVRGPVLVIRVVDLRTGHRGLAEGFGHAEKWNRFAPTPLRDHFLPRVHPCEQTGQKRCRLGQFLLVPELQECPDFLGVQAVRDDRQGDMGLQRRESNDQPAARLLTLLIYPRQLPPRVEPVLVQGKLLPVSI